MLRVSKKMVYALETVVDIAYNAGSEPAQSREITQRQGIPQRYLEQVMQRLVHAGVLKGVRGPRGGYRLARERRRITVGDVARVVNECDEADPWSEPNGSPLADKVVRPLWRDVESGVMQQLDSITIEDLCNRAHARGVEVRDGEGAHFDI
ncbi:MAG: Rrf2 family transcriptional regulator [Proteobacteria bacterium]|nr:Rrf2 family transcriptional regulator [Pseudomonadota bacterium]MDA1131846.1 Rrf2 family transcriptional regulator [Pseudomonadota bacterium]